MINVSGGQRSATDEADGVLSHALQMCEDSNVLVIAAAGNDGCECLHVPAAVPSVLAVGALDAAGTPLRTSNWGPAYRSNGVLAPGQHVLGAALGGGTARMTGSSFATPIVTGIAALLLSLQQASGQGINPSAVRQAILDSALPCYPADSLECRPYLVGILNIPGAYDLTIKGGQKVTDSDVTQVAPQNESHTAEAVVGSAGPSSPGPPGPGAASTGLAPSADVASAHPAHEHQAATGVPPPAAPQPAAPLTPVAPVAPAATAPAGVVPSGQCSCNGGGAPNATVSNVFAIGIVGFDYGTEAGRDAFRSAMGAVTMPGSPPIVTTANPYDARQLAAYLDENPWDANKLIWTLELDGTPIYAIESEPTFGGEVYSPPTAQHNPHSADRMLFSSRVYRVLWEALRGHTLEATNNNYVSRVSIPGILTTRTRRLFSGQEVPVVVAQARNLFTWNEAAVVNAVVEAVESQRPTTSPPSPLLSPEDLALTVHNFLDKIYYQLRNLGQSPPDRALNYAATNAFAFANAIADGMLSSRVVPGTRSDLYTLDTITVAKSPYCRMDSDCWDVQVSWFDAEEVRRARVIYQFTVNVSAVDPVSLAPTHRFLVAP